MEGVGVYGKMQGVIETSPKNVWMLFVRINDWKKYGLPNLADARIVSEEVANTVGDNPLVKNFYAVLGNRFVDPLTQRRPGQIWGNDSFQYYDIPWPVADRWMIVKHMYDETKISQGIFRSEWSKLCGNVKTMEGSFLLEPFEGVSSRTLLTYEVRSNPNSHVPKFLLRWGAKRAMPASIRAIRHEAEREFGHPIPLLQMQR